MIKLLTIGFIGNFDPFSILSRSFVFLNYCKMMLRIPTLIVLIVQRLNSGLEESEIEIFDSDLDSLLSHFWDCIRCFTNFIFDS